MRNHRPFCPPLSSAEWSRHAAVKLETPTDAGRSGGNSELGSPDKLEQTSIIASQGTEPNREQKPAEEHLVGPVSTTRVTVSGQTCQALLDTGSQVTTVTDEYMSTHPTLQDKVLQKADVFIYGAGGQSVPHCGLNPVGHCCFGSGDL